MLTYLKQIIPRSIPADTYSDRLGDSARCREVRGRILLFAHPDKPFERERLAGAGHAPAAASEEALVEAARALEGGAWEEIYRRHAPQVYAYIYYRLGDRLGAEDLTSEVFVKAIGGISRYAYRGTPLLAWLYRIAHNVTADHRKAAARASRHQAPLDMDLEERADALAELSERSDMLDAIRTLTEEQQQVVILRFYQGLNHAEVARIMEKPEGAVKALQTRALRSLRRRMTDTQRRQGA
jgi:RNA polymerase sigma-70 factor (ECF subfamily)